MPISPPARPFADGALALTDKDVAAALADLGVAASLSVMRNRSARWASASKRFKLTGRMGHYIITQGASGGHWSGGLH